MAAMDGWRAQPECYARLDDLRKKLDDMASARAEAFLNREPAITSAWEAALQKYIHEVIAAAATCKAPAITPPAFTRRPIFICGSMKSGTTLLGQLLDAHPELTVLAGDTYFLVNLDRLGKEPYSAWRAYYLRKVINPQDQFPFWTLGQEHDQYLKYAIAHESYAASASQRPEEKFLAGVYALYAVVGQRHGACKHWVEKTPNNELYCDRLLHLFPDARFVHVVRDPRANLASLKKLYRFRHWDYHPWSVAGGIARSHRKAVTNRRRLGADRYHIIRYEDVVGNTPATMASLANFLGIQYTDSLTEPTINGLPATANSMYVERQVRGRVNKENAPRWSSELDTFEIASIVGLAGRHSMSLGYDLGAPRLSRLLTNLRYALGHLKLPTEAK